MDTKMKQFMVGTVGIKMILIILCMITLSVGVGAWDWDNGIDYTEDNRTIVIENAWGLPIIGEVIAEITILSDPTKSRYVEIGEDVTVLSFNLTNYGDNYTDGFKKFKFINMHNGIEDTEKSFSWVYAVYEEVEVTDYGMVCNDVWSEINQTLQEECTMEIIGTHFENQITDWRKFKDTDIPTGTFTVGIQTDVEEGDYYDGVPTFFGKEVERWATWKASVNDEHTTDLSGIAGGVDIGGWGMIIRTRCPLRVVQIDRADGSTATKCAILDNSNNFVEIANGSFVGDKCILDDLANQPLLLNDTNYTLITNATGSYTHVQTATAMYQLNQTNVNWEGGWFYGMNFYDSLVFEIQNVTTQCQASGLGISIEYPSLGNYSYIIDELNYTLTDLSGDCWYSTDNGKTNSSDTPAGQNFTGLTSIEGINNWTVFCNDSLNNLEWDNVTFEVDTILPSIVITSPLSLTNYGSQNKTEYLNWTVTDDNLDDCWYNYNITTNISLTCGNNNITFNVSHENYNLTFWANDSVGNVNSVLYSWNYNVWENNQTYNDPVSEGQTETFKINIDTNNTYSIGYLWLNGTSYSVTETDNGNNNYDLSSSIAIPTVTTNQNLSFFWQILLSGGADVDTPKNNVTVINFGIDNCTANEEIILNLTLKDEESDTTVNGALGSNIEVEVDILSLDRSILISSYNKTWVNESNVAVCIPYEIINFSSYSIDFTIGFDSTDRVWEFFLLENGTLDNSSSFNSLTNKLINLRDLLTADSTSFLFNYYTIDGLPVDNAIVHVFRKYIGEGVFKEVERAMQDEQGDTIVHLVEEDVIYYFVITQNGQITFTSEEYTAKCPSTPCTISLDALGGYAEFDEDWDLIDTGGYTIEINDATRTVELDFALTTPAEMNISVYEYNGDGTYTLLGDDVVTSTSGTASVLVPQFSGNKTFFATVYKDDEFIKSQWVDLEEDAGLYFGNTLALFLGALIILTLGLVAVSEGSLTIVFVLIGILITSALGIVDYRANTGASVIIYLVLAGGLIIYKLQRRNA